MKQQKTNTKYNNVKQHLMKKRTITSMQSYDLYGASRLSAIIFRLRKELGWDITTTPITIKDRNGETCTYGKYTLIATSEESVLQKKFEHAIMPAGKKIDKIR